MAVEKGMKKMKFNTILKAVCLSLVFVSFGGYASGKGSSNNPPPKPCKTPSEQTRHNNAMTGANRIISQKSNVATPANSSHHKSKI